MAEASSADRWATISHKFKAVLERGGDERLVHYRIAAVLRHEVAQSCGCDESSIYFYKFDHGPTPEYDRYERVDSPHDAVTSSEQGKTIGLGIQLEAGPAVLPNVVIVWPIDIDRDGTELTLNSPMMNGALSFDMKDDAKLLAAMKSIAEDTYGHICDALDFWTNGGRPPKRIGFG
ncbi:MAG: hypothetical protein J0I47_00245 [Sphingomonas sp.]|uniref:hypothetical protein n=1 Tax=Sphingomonas sp. TaxID=28214 RepID=UPI001AD4E081|nr:hypothetical protein [Sphingomonas sp.]MBN8806658.1 hypothetical protein [Sphingomonas sp.]